MVKQNNDFKKNNKQNQPKPKLNSVYVSEYLYLSNTVALSQIWLQKKGNYKKKHLPYWLKYTKYILTLVTLHNNLVYRIPLDSKI